MPDLIELIKQQGQKEGFFYEPSNRNEPVQDSWVYDELSLDDKKLIKQVQKGERNSILLCLKGNFLLFEHHAEVPPRENVEKTGYQVYHYPLHKYPGLVDSVPQEPPPPVQVQEKSSIPNELVDEVRQLTQLAQAYKEISQEHKEISLDSFDSLRKKLQAQESYQKESDQEQARLIQEQTQLIKEHSRLIQEQAQLIKEHSKNELSQTQESYQKGSDQEQTRLIQEQTQLIKEHSKNELSQINATIASLGKSLTRQIKESVSQAEQVIKEQSRLISEKTPQSSVSQPQSSDNLQGGLLWLFVAMILIASVFLVFQIGGIESQLSQVSDTTADKVAAKIDLGQNKTIVVEDVVNGIVDQFAKQFKIALELADQFEKNKDGTWRLKLGNNDDSKNFLSCPDKNKFPWKELKSWSKLKNVVYQDKQNKEHQYEYKDQYDKQLKYCLGDNRTGKLVFDAITYDSLEQFGITIDEEGNLYYSPK